MPTINESSSLIYSQLLAASIGGVKSSADAALSNELSKRFDEIFNQAAPEFNHRITNKIVAASLTAVVLQPFSTIISKLATDPLTNVSRDIFSGNIHPMAGGMSSVKRSVAFGGCMKR